MPGLVVFGRADRSVLKLNEIFYSIQGESSWVGTPTVFVRLSGCNLRCRYCDTTYAFYAGQQSTVEEVIERVLAFKAGYVCLTGGEPLLQPDVLPLMSQLCDLGLNVSLETSGSLSCVAVDPRIKKVIDVKTPDSGAWGKFDLGNLPAAAGFSVVNTEYKFVLCSEADFDWSLDFCNQHHLFDSCMVLFSPAHQRVNPKWLAEKILSREPRVRLQTQLHKSIWSPHARGI